MILSSLSPKAKGGPRRRHKAQPEKSVMDVLAQYHTKPETEGNS